jgi:hypothetical protein
VVFEADYWLRIMDPIQYFDTNKLISWQLSHLHAGEIAGIHFSSANYKRPGACSSGAD